MNRLRSNLCLAGMALLCSLPGLAATVYKSIDANGVVTFSDSKPPEEILVEILEIDALQPTNNEAAQQRLENMRETTDRMVADRMARERHRAELRNLDAQTAAQQTAAQQSSQIDNNNSITYTNFIPYRVHRPWRSPRVQLPEHPITRPPMRPSQPNLPPGVRPLPGNEYPASLIRRGYDPKVRAALR
ncbi:MAG: DUF4124 domain-containing protein [Halioglobus sp.]